MVRLILAAILALLLTGCSAFIPREGLQGGSNVAYLHRTWHSNGKLASECVVDRDGLSQYGSGVAVTVEGDCAVTFEAPEVTQGDASITRDQVQRFSLEEIIAIGALARQIQQGGVVPR